MTAMALGCNCILTGSPLNLSVLSWKSQGNMLVSAHMLLFILAWVCPPEITPVAGAGVFFSLEMQFITSTSLGWTSDCAPSRFRETILSRRMSAFPSSDFSCASLTT